MPAFAIKGEGMQDYLIFLFFSPKLLSEGFMFNAMLESIVLEMKMIADLGTTINILLTGGRMQKGETIAVMGLNGRIVLTIRALLTPHPMK